nr:MAG TPA: hypothetical protein [Bacteriophage sp.]
MFYYNIFYIHDLQYENMASPCIGQIMQSFSSRFV